MEEKAKVLSQKLDTLAGAVCAYFEGAVGADEARRLTGETLAEIAAGCAVFGVTLALPTSWPKGSGAYCPELADAARVLRVAGLLPYYTAKALGCFFAAAGKEGDGKVEIVQTCGFTFEKELVQQISDARAAVLAGRPLVDDPKRIAMVKEAYRLGYFYEKTYRGCAQCTLAALFDVVGNRDEHLFRITNTFASGMGLFGDGACGGYSGGLLFLGNYAGRRIEFFDGDKEEKDKCMMLCDMLHRKFIDAYGSVICHGIHQDIFGRPFHIRRSDEKEAFEAAGAHKLDKCTAVVGTAAMWTVEVLLDAGLIKA